MSASLRTLAAAVGIDLDDDGDRIVAGITHDSRVVRPGELFVALPGSRENAAAYLRDAAQRGAIAACIGRDAAPGGSDSPIPLLLVHDPRAAYARLSAAFYGDPARTLRLIGITGTLGKTSTATLVQAALVSSSEGAGVGVVGSLGADVRGHALDQLRGEALPDLAGMTTPDPPALHRALRAMADAGVRLVIVEVTSHALAQGRVEGLRFELGVITNLVPDEHLEFHGTREDYLRTKARFLDHLAPDAPLIFDVDDPLVRQMIAGSLACARRPIIGVSLAAATRAVNGGAAAAARHDAAVSVERLRVESDGASFVLRVGRPLPRLDGTTVDRTEIPIRLPALGIQHVMNASLAAATALVAGAEQEAVTHALAEMPPVPRRMEVIRSARPLVIDDTAGNPETLRAVFASIEAIPRSGLRIVFGLRGSRGVEINARLAATLAELVCERTAGESVHLVVTWNEDTAIRRDQVKREEREAALQGLDRALCGTGPDARLRYETEPTLAGAIGRLLEDVHDDELVLILGTQAMDTAAERVREALTGKM